MRVGGIVYQIYLINKKDNKEEGGGKNWRYSLWTVPYTSFLKSSVWIPPHNLAYSEKLLPNTSLDLAFFQNTIEISKLSCFSRQIKFSVKTHGANSDTSFVDFRYQEVECRISIFNWSMSQHTKKHPQIGFSQIFLAFFICACSSFQLGINDTAAWQTHKKKLVNWTRVNVRSFK